jgi:hypothetical protein
LPDVLVKLSLRDHHMLSWLLTMHSIELLPRALVLLSLVVVRLSLAVVRLSLAFLLRRADLVAAVSPDLARVDLSGVAAAVSLDLVAVKPNLVAVEQRQGAFHASRVPVPVE